MKLIKTAEKMAAFKVWDATRSVQSATMVLQPGQSTGQPQNEHPHSEQWLFVVSGRVQQTIGRGGEPDGFVSLPDSWICQKCYTNFVALRSLAFISQA